MSTSTSRRVVKLDDNAKQIHGYKVQGAGFHENMAGVYGHLKSHKEAMDACRGDKPYSYEPSGAWGVVIIRRPKNWRPKSATDLPADLGEDCRLEHWALAIPMAAWRAFTYNRRSIRQGWSTWAVLAYRDELAQMRQRFQAVDELAGNDNGRMYFHDSFSSDEPHRVAFMAPFCSVEMQGDFFKAGEEQMLANVRRMFKVMRKAWRQTEPKRAVKVVA